MRRRIVSFALLSLLILPAGAGIAAGYEDTGYDPDDRAIVASDPDIASTTRRVWRKHSGRFLSIVLRAYEEFGIYWRVKARLDSRGGPRVDYTLSLFNADHGGTGCNLYRRTDIVRELAAGHFQQSGDRASCGIRIRHLHPTKAVRWKLISESGYEDGDIEYAPNDRTWYT